MCLAGRRNMAENTSPGMGGSGEPDDGGARPQPWFPPPADPEGFGQPAPGAGYGPPGGQGQPGWYGPPDGQGQPECYGQPPYGAVPGTAQAPKPGVIPLRPLSVGEILDGAITSIRRNPKATLGIAAVLLTISTVLTTGLSLILVHAIGPVAIPSSAQHLTTAQATRLLSRLLEVLAPVAGVSVILAFAVETVLTGLLTAVVGRSVLGQRITAGDAWRIARPRLAALIGATLLISVFLVGVWAVYAVLLLFLVTAGAPAAAVAGAAVLGAIAAVVVTIWFAVMFRMAAPVVVLEREGPARSLVRSWRLVQRNFWRVFGISLLAGLIVLVTTAVLEIPFTLIARLAGGGSSVLPGIGGTVAGALITAVGGIVAGAVAQPISAGVAVLLYVDLRMRRGRLDLALQAAAAGGAATGDEFASLWRPGTPVPAAGQGTAPPGPPTGPPYGGRAHGPR
jgi:hypothetical protein